MAAQHPDRTAARICRVQSASGAATRAATGKATRWSSTSPISRPKTDFQGSRENLHLVERWTRVDANTLEYAVTIEDPTTWTKPWTVKQELTQAEREANRIYNEPRCHEGNYGLPALLLGHARRGRRVRRGQGPDPATKDTATDLRHREAASDALTRTVASHANPDAGSLITVAIRRRRRGDARSSRVSVTRTAGQAHAAGAHGRRQAELQRRLAGAQRSELGPAGARGACRRGDAAGRLSLCVRAGAGGAGARARRGRRRARLARRRAGRRADSVQAGSAGDARRRTRSTGSIAIRSSSAICRAFRARCTCRIRSDRPEHEQDPDGLRVRERGAHDSPGQGRGPAGRHLDGPLGRPLGRRHARRRRDAFQRQDLVRPGGQFPQRRAARGRTLHADHAGRASATRRRSRIRRSSRARGRSRCRSIAAWSRTSSCSNIRCIEFAEEFLYGNLRKQQLVKHWEGETMSSTSRARFRRATSSMSGTGSKREGG